MTTPAPNADSGSKGADMETSSRPASPPPERQRGMHLTTFDQYRLDLAIRPLREAFGFGSIYLVGSVMERRDFRDVDVRVILSDDEFDALFATRKGLWSVFCYAVTCWLRADTGLPIDFQVQRRTEANDRHSVPNCGKHRSALGLKGVFAGGGDGTRFAEIPEESDDD